MPPIKMVRERTLIEKTVYEVGPQGSTGAVLSQQTIVDGPERVRDHVEGESDLPTPRPLSGHYEMGYWKRLQKALFSQG